MVRQQQVAGTFLINNSVKATAAHRFATIDGWRSAEDRIGDVLITADGWQGISSINYEPNLALVCQMTVLGQPCFYANGYLVHNDK